MIFFGLGVVLISFQVVELHSALTEASSSSNPYNVFQDTARIGLPVAFLLSILAMFFLRFQLAEYLLPLLATLMLPILVWTIYKFLFIASSDSLLRQEELVFAHDLIEVLFLGSLGAIVAAGFGVCISKLFKLEDGRDRSVNLNMD